MSLLDRLLGRKPPTPPPDLRFACTLEGGGELPASTRVFATDRAGLEASHVQRVLRAADGEPVLFVGPGLAPSGLRRLQGSRGASVRPAVDADVPHLVEAVAAATGGRTFTRELGVGDFAPWPQRTSAGKVLLPQSCWETLARDELGRAERLSLRDGVLTLGCSTGAAAALASYLELAKGWERSAQMPGERERAARILGLFGLHPPPGADRAPPRDASRAGDGFVPAGLASRYLVTDVEAGRAVLEGARLVLFGYAPRRLEALLPLLESAAAMDLPLVLVAPSFGDEVLTALVVNKLAGVLRVGAIELGAAPAAVDALARATGATVLAGDGAVPADPSASPRVDATVGFCHATVAPRRS